MAIIIKINQDEYMSFENELTTTTKDMNLHTYT